jgi:hypothetical protein
MHCTEQLLMAERREKAQREHFEQVGKDNHAALLLLYCCFTAA